MTPLIKFDNIFLKREDANPTGSAKDRAISFQIDNLIAQQYSSAVISSTGNAAISAQYYCRQKNIPLTIFVSPHTNPNKLSLLKNYTVSNKPVSDAFKFSQNHRSYNLRQSTDPIALLGYQQIALELLEQLPQVTSIFIPVGSGTTLLGISQKLPVFVKIFAVQPASYCPVASHFDKNYSPESTSKTDSLSAKLLPLKNKVIAACFGGVVIQNNDIKDTFDTSPEGNLAYAGYLKAKNIYDVGPFPVILLTGAKR